MRTKWLPMKAYNDQGASFLIQGKRSSNGLIRFRTVRIGRLFGCCYEFPVKLDFDAQLARLLEPNP